MTIPIVIKSTMRIIKFQKKSWPDLIIPSGKAQMLVEISAPKHTHIHTLSLSLCLSHTHTHTHTKQIRQSIYLCFMSQCRGHTEDFVKMTPLYHWYNNNMTIIWQYPAHRYALNKTTPPPPQSANYTPVHPVPTIPTTRTS